MMMQISIATAVVLALGAGVQAQPAPPLPPPYAYRPPQPLSDDERTLLEHGEISDARVTGGEVAAVFAGLGIGQAIQGRWLETGWMFTLGDLGAASLTTAGMLERFGRYCESACVHRADALLAAGAVVVVGVRVWQSIDAFVGPANHNRRVRELRIRGGMIAPYVVPTNTGGAAGVALRF